MKQVTILSLLLVTGVCPLLAQEGWSLSGQVRHRFESVNKDFNSNVDANNFNLLRARVNVSFTPVEDVQGFLQFQDARVFGEETNTLGDASADNLDLHQGYFKVTNVLDLPVDAKVGRMEVNFGPQRLVGAVGWDNFGRSFDGVMLNVHKDEVSLDIFNLDEVETGAQDDIGDRRITGVYGNLKVFEHYQSQIFWIWQRQRPSNDLSRHTLGLYMKGAHGRLSNEVEFAYQLGKRTALDVKAFMAALNLAYKLSETGLKPTIGGGADYLSGDDNGADGDFKVFDTLYATNHKYYGYMDYFLNIPVNTANLGLLDLHAKASVSPWSRTTISGAFHIFSSAKDATLFGGATSNAFGQEIDVVVKHMYNKAVTILGGGALFFPDDIFKQSRGDDLSSWLFLMTTVNL